MRPTGTLVIRTHHKANPPQDTQHSTREHRGHSWGTPAESGASTPQSVMETNLLISAIWLLAVYTNTLVSNNTITWHTHALLYKCTLTRWQSYVPDLVSDAQTFPATHYTREHIGPHMHIRAHPGWPWLSIVSRSGDTWKDTLERGPFHSNSAQQHLERTRWLSHTVVKGMRVLNSTAAHSSLLDEWGREESFMDTALHRLHTHTLSKALTHPPSTMESEISNLSERASGNWRRVWNISDYIQMVHTQHATARAHGKGSTYPRTRVRNLMEKESKVCY